MKQYLQTLIIFGAFFAFLPILKSTYEVGVKPDIKVASNPVAVATCITGDVRAFPKIWRNLNRSISLLTDGFLNHNYFVVDMGRERDNPMKLSDLSDGLVALDYIAFNVVNPSKELPLKALSCPEGTLQYKTSNMLYQVDKWSTCLDLVEKQEKLQGYAYEYVIRIRPDMLLSWNASSLNLKASIASDGFVHVLNYRHVGSLSDHFGIMNRKVASIYLRTIRFFDQCWDTVFMADACFNHGQICSPQAACPECLLSTWLRTNGLDWEGHPIKIALTNRQGDFFSPRLIAFTPPWDAYDTAEFYSQLQ